MNSINIGRLGHIDTHEDLDNADSSSSDSEGRSDASTDTDKALIIEWREKAGEIPGDEDYANSDSDSDDEGDEEDGDGDGDENGDTAINDWDHAASSAAQPATDTNRPWAFYELRSSEKVQEPRVPASPTRQKSIAEGMYWVYKLTQQACLQKLLTGHVPARRKLQQDNSHATSSIKSLSTGKQVAQKGTSSFNVNQDLEVQRQRQPAGCQTDSEESEDQPLAARRRSFTAIPSYPIPDSPPQGMLGGRASSVPQVGSRHRTSSNLPFPSISGDTDKASTTVLAKSGLIRDIIHTRAVPKDVPFTKHGISTDADTLQGYRERRHGLESAFGRPAIDSGYTTSGANTGGGLTAGVAATVAKRALTMYTQAAAEKKKETSATEGGSLPKVDMQPKANAAVSNLPPNVYEQTGAVKKVGTSLIKEGGDSQPKTNIQPKANTTESNMPPGVYKQTAGGKDGMSTAKEGGCTPTEANTPQTNAAGSGPSPARADFELSLYRRGTETVWEKGSVREPCLGLLYSPGRSTVATDGGVVDVSIDPTQVTSFTRSVISASNGSRPLTMLTINYEDGSPSSELVFDRSDGSQLEISKIQCSRFIKWLRSVKPDITCV